MPRNPVEKCNVTWENRYGTAYEGQLPQYRVSEPWCNIHLDLITMPGITLTDFHYYHIKCPYSTQSQINLVRDSDTTSPTYWKMITTSGSLGDHTATSGIMIRWSKGAKHGHLCVDDNCPYYLGTASGITTSGIRYFYY
jgi:hypothetical protein